MASQSSSSSSNSQHLNRKNQLPNSDSNVQEYNFFGPVQVGSSSYFPNNNEEKYENNNEMKNHNSNNLEFVKLSKDDLVHGSRVKEYNFLSPIQVGSSSCFPNNNAEGKDESNNEEKNSDLKSYSCSYCNGKYSSLQALGGHQNAHKAERALQMQLIKQRYDGSAFNLGQPRFNPYLNHHITPFTPYNYMPIGVGMESIMIQKSPNYISPRIGHHGGFTPNNYRPLGVRIESMIQKSPCISPRIGLGALRLHDILNPSLVSMRNNIEGCIGGATTSRTADEVGTSNRNGGILRIGESSTNIMAPTSTMNGIHNLKLNIEEEPSDSESSGLDLSLKL